MEGDAFLQSQAIVSLTHELRLFLPGKRNSSFTNDRRTENNKLWCKYL